MTGTLYGIGVGPGDPELITMKAHRILRDSYVVAYPQPDNGPSFARSIVEHFITAEQLEIPIVVPMDTARHPAKAVYDAAAETIAHHLDAGSDVVVLCEVIRFSTVRSCICMSDWLVAIALKLFREFPPSWRQRLGLDARLRREMMC
jgi:hypothetical protein